ncbi:MAG: bifunctional UDP-N-acetylglucosamine diphosphorylase/glucosamine-1-phosphate N-acetyltransferase GlmU [Nitrospirota bacterium]
MHKFTAIILAAGMGKRMKSKMAKVIHPVAGRPMLLHVVDMVKQLNPEKIIVVVGHQRERVEEILNETGTDIVLQEKQLGTGHAVLQTEKCFSQTPATVLILNGDTPLLTEDIVKKLMELHFESNADITLLTAKIDNPNGYGRVIRDKESGITRIIEDRDLKEEERGIDEINVGIYVVETDFLFNALKGLRNDNSQNEYYLPDIIDAALKMGHKANALRVDTPEIVLGINNRIDLAFADKVLRRRVLERHMLEGVTIISPETTFIDKDVKIGMDTIIYPNTYIEGKTDVGRECIICPNTMINNSRLGERVVIKNSSVVTDSVIEDDVSIGPFSHLRPGSTLKKRVKIGNFVEVKKTEVGEGSKANHLTYLGDTIIGRGVNIGAGTITCNYDGENKFQTIIEDDVFVGSDTQLIAPVKIGKGAMIGAGSTISKEVPPDSLALSRTKQVNIKRKKGKRGKGK